MLGEAWYCPLRATPRELAAWQKAMRKFEVSLHTVSDGMVTTFQVPPEFAPGVIMNVRYNGEDTWLYWKDEKFMVIGSDDVREIVDVRRSASGDLTVTLSFTGIPSTD